MLENNKLYIDAIEEIISDIPLDALSSANILVTGATGLLGKPLTDTLTHFGGENSKINVWAASRSEKSFKERFEARDNLHYLEFDLTKPLENAPKFDYIIHAASNADPKMFDSDPVGTMTSNFMGTYNLLEYARKTDCKRFLYVSTGEVYGQYDGKSEAFIEGFSGEVDFTTPRGCYSSSKRAAENLLSCFKKQYGTDFVTARLSHTYGPSQLERDSRAMSQFFRLASCKKDIVLKSTGETVRSYTCVFDAVSAILTLLLKGESGEAYNVSNKNSVVSIAELAKEIANEASVAINFDIGEVKGASKITRGVLSSKKLEGLGWSGKYPLNRGVKVTLGIMNGETEKD
jgi:nucleoside-diphosphate-sugar epimerase